MGVGRFKAEAAGTAQGHCGRVTVKASTEHCFTFRWEQNEKSPGESHVPGGPIIRNATPPQGWPPPNDRAHPLVVTEASSLAGGK